MLRVTRMLLAWLLLATAAGAGFAAAPGDPVTQRTIGPSAVQGFSLVEVLRRLKRLDEADLLARYVVNAFVAELSGLPHDPAVTVAQAIRLGRELPPMDRAIELRARWSEQVNSKVALAMDNAPRALPVEIDAMGPQLAELAPGLWGTKKDPPRLYLLATGVNRAAVPLPVSEFRLLLREKPATEAIKFECSPERDKPFAVMQPGQRSEFLCRSVVIPVFYSGATPATVLTTARTNPALMTIEPRELDDARSAERMVQALADLTQPEMERFLQTASAATAASANSQGSDATAARGPDLLQVLRDDQPKRLVGQPISRTELAYQLLVLAVVVVGYIGFAKLIGNGAAALLFWFMATIYVGLTLAKEPSSFSSGNIDLLALAFHAFMLSLPIGATMILYFMYQLAVADREVVKRNIFGMVVSFLAKILLALITGRRR